MSKWMIAGCGTEVGKTVVAAILTTLLRGDYWKPVECGARESNDTATMQRLIDTTQHQLHPPTYSLQAPLSPHHAARLENVTIDLRAFRIPQTDRPLIIESVGGILVPLTPKVSSLDLFKHWDCRWVIVSQHYLGSINHTLLTVEVLKSHQIPIAGIVFNGEPNQESEEAIQEIGKLPCLGRVLPEKTIDFQTIQKYAKQWQPQLSHSLL
jgi:dethiobiotin synthetase